MIINFFISMEPHYFTVYDGDWCAFWGNYIASFCTLIIIFITIKLTRWQIQIEQARKDIDETRSDISKRIAEADFEILVGVVEKIKRGLNPQIALSHLDILYHKSRYNYYSANMRYSLCKETNSLEYVFYSNYKKHIRYISRSSNNLIAQIQSGQLEKIEKNVNMKKIENLHAVMVDSAKQYIKELDKNYKSVINKSIYKIIFSL